MQVVLQEPDPLSGVPEYLRIAVKPYVDAILGNVTAPARQALLDQGAGILRRDLDYIKSEIKSCTCAGATGLKGWNQPYRALEAGMPADKSGVNRRDLAAQGIGLLLPDLAAIQQGLGKCTCKGRKAAAATSDSDRKSSPVCKKSEYCCPDAKHCLTPTTVSCKNDADACKDGEVCCPLTKICVIPDAPCVSPCEDQNSYCCPDALHCLTPVDPGVFCDPKDPNACGGNGNVCCPITSICVSVGAACTPPVRKDPFLATMLS